MYTRIKRSGGQKNLVGIRGIGVWTHPSRFDNAIEINAFTKGQFKQMNGDDDDDDDDDESVTFTTEIEEDIIKPGKTNIYIVKWHW